MIEGDSTRHTFLTRCDLLSRLHLPVMQRDMDESDETSSLGKPLGIFLQGTKAAFGLFPGIKEC